LPTPHRTQIFSPAALFATNSSGKVNRFTFISSSISGRNTTAALSPEGQSKI
jgi:hypothetical protein